MTPIKAGDEVRVIVRNPHRKTPEGGYRATVTKVARKYATAAYEVITQDWHGKDVTTPREIEFDIATGKERGSEGNYGTEVISVDEAARRIRSAAALTILRERKIRLEYGHGFTLEQIEALAEVAKTFTTPEREG
jgi:hypothetical protein